MDRFNLILASASPRRLELLREAGLRPTVRPASVSENRGPDEAAERFVVRIAGEKASYAEARAPRDGAPSLVIAADTIVVVDGDVLGKPSDEAGAVAMLRRLSGREHEVLTGVCLIRSDDGRSIADFETTRVRFRDLDAGTVASYVATGEPMDKAGSYGIQGRASAFVERVDGSWSNVVGLPLERIPEWTRRIGIEFETLVTRPSR